MLVGSDISHWNYPFQVPFGEFQIFKATEGIGHVDIRFADYCSQINDGQLIGFYHYARPDLHVGNARNEAQHFVTTVRKYIGKALFILDWEEKSLNYDDSYALTWLEEVERLTGVRPIIYTSSTGTKKLPNVAKAGYKLWIAHYDTKFPRIYNFNDYIMWQYTSKPFDMNLFNGTVEDWRKLCAYQ